MEFKRLKNFYILKISRGEEIQRAIEEFSKKEAKNGGFFIGIGAVEEATLAHYSVKNKKYTQKKIKRPLEIASLIGNVCFSEGEIIVHSHVVLADKNLKTFSGHLIEAKVSGTLEIIFFPFTKKIEKIYDKITGLRLIKIGHN
jgi:predicted DNA-binding protein with PD1-like motif